LILQTSKKITALLRRTFTTAKATVGKITMTIVVGQGKLGTGSTRKENLLYLEKSLLGYTFFGSFLNSIFIGNILHWEYSI